MPIYKVTSSEEVDWEENRAVLVRAIDNLEAIDIAI